jgi:hypothetical protein
MVHPGIPKGMPGEPISSLRSMARPFLALRQKTSDTVLKGERIARRGTGCGIVADAPNGTSVPQVGQLMGKRVD